MSEPAPSLTRRRWGCLLLALSPLLVLAAAFWIPSLVFRARERAFDAASWRSASAEERGLQVNSLRAQRVLADKTRAEVRALLGPPDRGDQGDVSDQRWVYEVGSMDRARWQWPLIMVLDFEDQQVVRVSVYD